MGAHEDGGDGSLMHRMDRREFCAAAGRAAVFTVACAGTPPLPAREHLESRIRLDFALGRVVTVDGWVLSETEARASARKG